MKKRLLSWVLAGALAVSLAPAALAQAPEADMAQVLAAMDIMAGYPDGQLRLDQSVTRAEFTKMTVAASPMGENVGTTTTVSPYPDVPSTHWAASYVEAAVSAGLVNGFLDGTFRPSKTITLAEGVTMVVRLLGYQDLDFPGRWPSGQMALYHSLGLDEGIPTDDNSPMTRRDTMNLFYNLLTADTKEGRPYLAVLGKPMTPTGELDRVALINDAMDGPVVMAPGWADRLGFDLSGAVTVYRAGKLSDLTALQTNDVIYYSDSMRTLWAYTGKVSGQLQAVSPSAASPTSVTVAGRTYPIETSDAAYALSNLGGHLVGEAVTLLLGRGGGVAAVADPSASTGTGFGIVTAVTKSAYTDPDGNAYTSHALVVTGTDGNSYTYPVEASSTLDEGDLVQVTQAGSKTEVKRAHGTGASGTFNADATKLGSTQLSPSLEILDTTTDGDVVRIFPSRLANTSLKSGDVRLCHKDASGRIDVLILNDYTGDLYTYGLVTNVEEVDEGPIMHGYYEYDVAGQKIPYAIQNGVLNLKHGPVKIKGDPVKPERFYSMDSVELTAVDALSATTEDNSSFPVSPCVAVYESANAGYLYSSLDRVRAGYRLTGYYDKSAREGGCIRVILATPIN